MAASERLSLLLEARTSGEQDLARLERQVNQVLAAANRTEAAGSKLAQASDATESSLQRFGDNVRDFVSNPLQALGDYAGRVTTSMGAVGGVIAGGAAIIAGAGAAYLSFANSLGDIAEEALNMSIRTGLTVKETQQFSFAAKQAGVDAGAFETAMKTLSETITGTSAESEKTRQKLRDLGIATRDSSGNARAAGELWLDLADKIGSIEDPYKRASTAQDVFGKAGKQLLPVLAELRGSVKELKEIGLGISEGDARKLDENADKLTLISKILDTIAQKSKIELVLSLTGTVDGSLDFLKKYASNGGGLGDLINSLNFLNPSSQATSIANVLRTGGAGFSIPAFDARIVPGQGVVTSRSTNGDFRFGFSDQLQLPSSLIRGSEDPASASARAGIGGFLKNIGTVGGDGLKTALAQTGEARDAAIQSLRALENVIGIDPSVVAAEKAKVASLTNEYTRLEKAIDAAAKAKAKAEADAERLRTFTQQFAKAVLDPNGNVRTLQNRQFQPFEIQALEEFQAFNSPIDPSFIPQSTRSTLPTNVGTFGANRFGVVQDQQISATRQDLEYQRAKIELLTGPGGELAAIQRIAQLKLDALEREKDLGADAFDIEQQRRQIAIDTELQIISLRRNALNIGKDQLFAVASGQTSPGDFFKGTGTTIARNAFGRVYDNVIGPALGKVGAASGLGELLSGTAFDPSQRVGVDGNTRATDENTAALRTLTGVIGGGVLGGGSTAGIPAIFGGGASKGGFGSIFSLLGFGKKSNSTAAYTETGGEGDELASLQSISGGGRALRNVGIAAAGIGGAFGVYSGIRTGGARGATAAIGSGAGATAAILSLAGVSGPAAPILAGIALGAEVIRSMLPDPKAARDRRINSILDGAVYNGPMSSAYSEDIYGRGSFYNKRGEMTVILYQNVQAWDSSSFIDHRQDIADATRQAMQEAHPINFEIQQLQTAY